MKRKKRSAPALLLVITFLASLLAPSGVASAVSDYDTTVNLTDTLKVTNGPGTTLDVSFSWMDVLADDSLAYMGNRAAFRSAFAAAIAEGTGWAVAQANLLYANPDEYAVRVYVQTESLTSQGIFSTNCVGSGVPAFCMTNAVSATIYHTGTGALKIGVEYSTSNISRAIAWSDPSPTVTQNLFFANLPIIYPGGYEGATAPIESPHMAKFVAMGDSFSSGEGNPAFEPGTDEDGVNQCHRSPHAYPRLLQAGRGMGLTAFVACSGATTNDVLGIPETNDPTGRWNEPPQVDVLSTATELVTITIGGNDAGFGAFARECLLSVCDEFTDIYKEVVWRINNELPDKLENTFGTILNEAENADIYVSGYPTIAPYKGINEPFDQDCGGLYGEFPNNWGDARTAHEVTNLLNGAIETAVDAVNTQYSSSRLVFVPVENGAFADRDVCSSDSYFHGIVWPDTEYSVHPNVNGHIAYKEDLSNAMS